mmetsp:Transcript_37719/g.82870  ORF Transcript_37719/g.82870 Transcript_37719/m.82870 type:complete len:447 (+) Transcript_37719:84-1424(+)|eukprot:CAMPEP_0170644094 /NCGR_PEP_ID=MMETSP0224-20130122/42279_1 /TAXON_ID=285029 /ORGANISM="Togula jolla, Strain CCCM 725" /LENGTH=446 /DNA_ID=CAMNT_0010975053 /DNA_START=58 /DNA_END=1398 /DNA_ORIENTATION=+
MALLGARASLGVLSALLLTPSSPLSLASAAEVSREEAYGGPFWKSHWKRTQSEQMPPNMEERSAADAHNAGEAAKDAEASAQVAGKLAAHSLEVQKHASKALQEAREALQKAQVNAKGTHAEALRKAEGRLRTLTASSAKFSHDKRRHLESRRDNLNVSANASDEVPQMELEIRWLRKELEDPSFNDNKLAASTDQELQTIQRMLDNLAAREAGQAQPGQHKELKAEIERLRASVDRLKRHGDVVASFEPKTTEAPAHGELVYSIPASTQKPRALLRPLADLQQLGVASSDGADVEADGEDSEAEVSASGQDARESSEVSGEDGDSTAVHTGGDIDIDTAMPYGDLEPFGREDTAQELTEASIHESDEMVDQIERAEVAEEKRATFRALTRLRGAAITSFDGVARSQTGQIDGFNKVHQWRKAHPIQHLANKESDVSKWAFPGNSD